MPDYPAMFDPWEEIVTLRQQLSDVRALKKGEAGEWQRLRTDRDAILTAATRVVQLAERDNTAGTYKAIAELRQVLDERGGGQ